MNESRWRQIEVLFHRAHPLTEEARHRFFDQVCADDRELREDLGSLLAAADVEDDFLSQPIRKAGLLVIGLPRPRDSHSSEW